MKRLLVFLSDGYADYEFAYLSSFMKMNNQELIFIAPNLEVTSKGGITSIVDYSLTTFHYENKYDALVLVGGRYWRSVNFINNTLTHIIDCFVSDHKIVGSICDASTFLANNGYFNNKHHSGNGKQYLLDNTNPKKYLGTDLYQEKQCVIDLPFISANGTAGIAFGKAFAETLNIGDASLRNAFFDYHKNCLYRN